MKSEMMAKLIKEAQDYERGKMLRCDSEVEIDNFDEEIWISDYSESRRSAEPIKKVCDEDDVDIDEVIKVCRKHGWAYCL